MTAQLTRTRTSVTLEVTADVDITDLVDAGWHHEDDCPSAPMAPLKAAARAIVSLHRQAHPSQPADPWLCREEPCRSVDTDTLRRA